MVLRGKGRPTWRRRARKEAKFVGERERERSWNWARNWDFLRMLEMTPLIEGAKLSSQVMVTICMGVRTLICGLPNTEYYF